MSHHAGCRHHDVIVTYCLSRVCRRLRSRPSIARCVHRWQRLWILTIRRMAPPCQRPIVQQPSLYPGGETWTVEAAVVLNGPSESLCRPKENRMTADRLSTTSKRSSALQRSRPSGLATRVTSGPSHSKRSPQNYCSLLPATSSSGHDEPLLPDRVQAGRSFVCTGYHTQSRCPSSPPKFGTVQGRRSCRRTSRLLPSGLDHRPPPVTLFVP